MSKEALIVWGGWDGHEPEQVAGVFERELQALGFNVEKRHELAAFDDGDKLKSLSLIVPIWTMDSIKPEQSKNVQDAVESGVGLAGCHGGMCDAFRKDTDWQFMTGGQWVAHPGNDGVEYTVEIGPERGEINEGMNDFQVKSEQYYLHVDPAVTVWATTQFPTAPGPHEPNGPVTMPQVWTKRYGAGRVFYNALGHNAAVFEQSPTALELMRRGFKWAARRV